MPESSGSDNNNNRALFEERAFSQRFIRGIRKTGTGQFPFTVDCPTQAEFVKRDAKGNYVDNTLDAMWWAWQEALRYQRQRLRPEGWKLVPIAATEAMQDAWRDAEGYWNEAYAAMLAATPEVPHKDR